MQTCLRRTHVLGNTDGDLRGITGDPREAVGFEFTVETGGKQHKQTKDRTG